MYWYNAPMVGSLGTLRLLLNVIFPPQEYIILFYQDRTQGIELRSQKWHFKKQFCSLLIQIRNTST